MESSHPRRTRPGIWCTRRPGMAAPEARIASAGPPEQARAPSRAVRANVAGRRARSGEDIPHCQRDGRAPLHLGGHVKRRAVHWDLHQDPASRLQNERAQAAQLHGAKGTDREGRAPRFVSVSYSDCCPMSGVTGAWTCEHHSAGVDSSELEGASTGMRRALGASASTTRGAGGTTRLQRAISQCETAEVWDSGHGAQPSD